jgi:ABC-type uncharacterized transport system permease subunit
LTIFISEIGFCFSHKRHLKVIPETAVPDFLPSFIILSVLDFGAAVGLAEVLDLDRVFDFTPLLVLLFDFVFAMATPLNRLLISA